MTAIFKLHSRVTNPQHTTVARQQAVVLNLKIDTEETRMMGVENHVCELQMVLKSFAYMPVDFQLGFSSFSSQIEYPARNP